MEHESNSSFSKAELFRRLLVTVFGSAWLVLFLQKAYSNFEAGKRGLAVIGMSGLSEHLPTFGDLTLTVVLLIVLLKATTQIPPGPGRKRMRALAWICVAVVLIWWPWLRSTLVIANLH